MGVHAGPAIPVDLAGVIRKSGRKKNYMILFETQVYAFMKMALPFS